MAKSNRTNHRNRHFVWVDHWNYHRLSGRYGWWPKDNGNPMQDCICMYIYIIYMYI